MRGRSLYPAMAGALVALLGFLLATYLSLERWSGGAQLYCPTGGCAAVQESQYSVLFGVPVAAIGMVGYAFLNALFLLAIHVRDPLRRRLAIALAACASLGLAFSVYLVYLQFAVIHAICFWCMLSTCLEGIAWITAMANWRAVNSTQPVRGSFQSPVTTEQLAEDLRSER